jgi:ribosomal protein L24E
MTQWNEEVIPKPKKIRPSIAKCGFCGKKIKDPGEPCIYVVSMDKYFHNQECLDKYVVKENQ